MCIRDRLQLVPDTVDLVERVREWLIPFQLVARESGERLLLSMPETDIPVTIDTERFAWVLSNLVSNALRVGSVGSTVRIVITQEEDDAVLRVEDDGPGIPPDLEARLFEPFSHGRTAGTREGLVGLGLAITRDFYRIVAVGEVEEGKKGIGEGKEKFSEERGAPHAFPFLPKDFCAYRIPVQGRI